MKIEATSIEELFIKSGEHEELIRAIDRIIHESAPELTRKLFSGNSITMIGYGEMSWETSSDLEVWPLISLAPQKHTVNLYIAAEKDDIPLPQHYIDNFGKSNVGKNCIRINSLKKLDTDILKELVRETLIWANLKSNVYGKNGTRQE
ncbi:MAG: DUF1801 domain-containing protein [Spirochaetaceae bacterium]|jgi:hypothetical protein|nr:DUF1801 domain-containing protein [Spirochaetaceae bacterium]